jgi:hypothetical protein
MIPAEAVTKLRQKHPGTVRVAEENRGTLVQVRCPLDPPDMLFQI